MQPLGLNNVIPVEQHMLQTRDRTGGLTWRAEQQIRGRSRKNSEEALTDLDATEDLQSQVEQLKEDIAAIAATLANLGSQTVRDAKRTAKETYKSAYVQSEDVVGDLKTRRRTSKLS